MHLWHGCGRLLAIGTLSLSLSLSLSLVFGWRQGFFLYFDSFPEVGTIFCHQNHSQAQHSQGPASRASFITTAFESDTGRFFSKMSRQPIRRGVFRPVVDRLRGMKTRSRGQGRTLGVLAQCGGELVTAW
jgi:hypothetical protein